jgi:hypothetical protein
VAPAVPVPDAQEEQLRPSADANVSTGQGKLRTKQ